MKITYDTSIDAMYIKLNEKLVYQSSKKISEDVLVDYSKDGKIIGIEVLAASQNTILPVRKSTVPIQFSPA